MCKQGLNFCSLLLLFVVRSGHAQQPAKIPRIGYVSASWRCRQRRFNLEAFRQGLRDLGYFEGKNILVEYRYADRKQDRVPSLVAELVQLG